MSKNRKKCSPDEKLSIVRGVEIFFLAGPVLKKGFSVWHYLSTDLGHSWSTQYSNSIDGEGRLTGLGNFRQIVSYNQNLIATIDFKSIYISRDGGISWTSFNEGLMPDWTFSGLAIKPPYIWALTNFGGNAYRRPLTDIE